MCMCWVLFALPVYESLRMRLWHAQVNGGSNANHEWTTMGTIGSYTSTECTFSSTAVQYVTSQWRHASKLISSSELQSH